MFVNPYLPQTNSPYTYTQPQVATQQLQRQEVINVNGRPGAEAYQMAANSSVLMLDNTAPIVWLAQTDGACYKTLTAYDIVPHKEVKQEDMLQKLEERISKLEEKVNVTKPNSSDAAKQRKSAEQ